MVDAIGQAKGQSNAISQALDHKIVPWLIAALAYFGAQALETFRGNDTDMQATIQVMQVDLAIVKQRTEALAGNAPNRWTKQMHQQYADGVDGRIEELSRRIDNLEKRR